MSIVREFKKFILRGNVVDLAVGVIIGAAFGKIVTSLVSDMIMPPIGWALGGVDFSDLAIELPGSMKDSKDPTKMISVRLKYGAFIQAIIDFLIIAACLFGMIQVMNRLKKKEAEAPAVPTASEKLLTEIRDLLKK